MFIAYAVVLTTLTHWPRLRLPPESPLGDKTIHMLVFAIFTGLLWRTRWFSRRVIVVLVALAWSIVDELAQGIPILNRYVAVSDMIANAMGVGVAGTWLAALRPRCTAAPPRHSLKRAMTWTTSAVAVLGAMIVGAAYVNATLNDAQLDPGPWPRLEMLASLIHPRMLAALGLATGGGLGALFVGTYRSTLGASDA